MSELDAIYLWTLLIAMAIGTYAIRLSFLEVFHHVDEVPSRVEQTLKYMPAAVIAAILLPKLVLVEGDLLLSIGNEKLLAGALATVVAWLTRNMAATLIVGLGSLWILASLL